MDGGKCSVGVPGTMEKGQLATQWKRIRAAGLGQVIAARGEAGCESPSCGCSCTQESGTEEHHNNGQGDGAARIKVSQASLAWPHKCELFLAQWTHDATGNQSFTGR